MRIVTAAQMKQIERNADAAGVSYLQMMENAGTAAYHIIRSEFPQANRFLIVVGKGNNGGDGFVVARLAAQEGLSVQVVLVEGNPVTHDAAYNYERLSGLNVSVISLDALEQITDTDLIVDALYGTGFHGQLRPTGEKICRLMQKAGCPIAALDVPSGTVCDTGEAAENAVCADLTIAFDSFKPIHTAKKYCGHTVLADIGIPEECHILT